MNYNLLFHGFSSYFLFLLLHKICYTYKIDSLITWYIIHIVGNLYVVYLSINPIYMILSDPIKELSNPDNYYDTTIIILVLHAYHLLGFQCTKDDLFHHLFFVFIGCSTVYLFNNGYFSALSHFFICGLPGAIDYTTIIFYKLNYLTKTQRLRIGMYLNVWFRSPGLCLLSSFALMKFLYTDKNIYNIIELLLQVGMSLGNGQYYMSMVVYANGINDSKY